MSGGNCPETPRQKMIGMMYLFLTAMLALNVSGDLLQAFQLVDESIQQSIKAVENKNRKLYNEFYNAKESNPKKAEETYNDAEAIRKAADDLFNHITDLKLLMVRTADNPEATLDNYIGADNQDVAAQVMITEKGGQRSLDLIEKIEDYQKTLLSYVDERDTTIRINITNSLSTEAKKSEIKGEPSHSWQSQKFEHLPLSASLALMSSIQSNLRNAQSDVVSYLLTKIDEGSFKFNTIDPIVIPNSNYIIKGGKYTAKILLAARDSLNKPTVVVEGKTMPLTSDGKGLYEVVANSTGKRTWKGEISIIGPDGNIKRYPISETYQVVQPNVVISPTKMNVFYENVDNPVEISVPGVNSEDISVDFKNATYKKNGDEYIVKPKPGHAGGKSIVTVYANFEGKRQRLGSGEFRIKRVPNPVAKVAGKNEGRIKKSLLLAQSGVFAEMGDDFDFDLKFAVTGFNVSALKNGYLVEESSKNNKFTRAQTELIKGVSRGQKLFIDNVRAAGPDGSTRKLGSITFILD